MSTIIDEIERMTVLDLVNFKKALEDRWGVLVSNRLPMVTPDSVTPESPAEEQTEFSVTLSGFGANKIAVIKVVRELTSLGLREAKDLVESAPVAVREGVTREDAETAASKLREAGATAEVV